MFSSVSANHSTRIAIVTFCALRVSIAIWKCSNVLDVDTARVELLRRNMASARCSARPVLSRARISLMVGKMYLIINGELILWHFVGPPGLHTNNIDSCIGFSLEWMLIFAWSDVWFPTTFLILVCRMVGHISLKKTTIKTFSIHLGN